MTGRLTTQLSRGIRGVLLSTRRKVTPFALAGAGAMVFDPKDFAGASAQTRAALVYGGGVDFSLTRRIFVRAHRGSVYNSPTYDLAALSGVDRVTHRAEPC